MIADADITIIVQQQGKTPALLGKGTANATGEMWVTLTQKPTVGQRIAAFQETVDGKATLP